MHLKSLFVQGVRNLTTQTVELEPGFNFIHGANGAGKTAFLESVAMLSRGRSFRAASSKSVISHEQDSLILRGNLSQMDQVLAMRRERTGAAQLKVNGQVSNRLSELATLLPTQVVLPHAAELIYGSPAERRGYVDWGLFHVEQGFVELSRRYRTALLQRNAWLKAATQETAALALDPWFRQIVEYAGQISAARADYIQRLRPYVDTSIESLFPGLDLRLSYAWGGLQSLELAEKKLSESFDRDVKLGTTHRGPHRADLTLSSDDVAASEIFSRGQAKAAATALLLAQAVLQQDSVGKRSVFLIDDFGAELDAEHWARFSRALADLQCQVIATSTESPDTLVEKVDCAVFHVEHGQISRQQ
ncbi:MAG: DNA replication/repair protein RecF [Pseudomonadota bacterium]